MENQLIISTARNSWSVFDKPARFFKGRRIAESFNFLLPSFLASDSHSDGRKKPSKPISNIAALDGLRGISCLFVLHDHWTTMITDSYRNITGALNMQYFFHWPFMHLLWHGAAQVSIFFVLSGYVLSNKCIKQIHQRSWTDFHQTIASSVFRRGIRIFLPPMISFVLCAILVQLGAFTRSRMLFVHQQYIRPEMLEMREELPPSIAGIGAQIWSSLAAMLDLIYPSFPMHLAARSAQYNNHLWTIPIEYYCSMALFCVLLSTSRLHCAYRLACHIALVMFCWFTYNQYNGLFFAGMTITELDQLYNKHQPFSRLYLCGVRVITIIRSFVLVVGLYLLSCPRQAGEETAGIRWIFAMTPSYLGPHASQDLIHDTGAILTVWCLSNISTDSRDAKHDEKREFQGDPRKWHMPSFRQIVVATLANPVARYLGRISFSLYILHGWVIKSIGYNFVFFIYDYVIYDPVRRKSLAGYAKVEYSDGAWHAKPATGSNSTATNEPARPPWAGLGPMLYADDRGLTGAETAALWIIGYVVIVPITIWAADIFTRLVDEPCVLLGKKVESWMAVRDHAADEVVLSQMQKDPDLHFDVASPYLDSPPRVRAVTRFSSSSHNTDEESALLPSQ